MRKLLLLSFLIVLVSGLIFNGCAKPASTPAPTPTPVPAPAPKPAPTVLKAVSAFSMKAVASHGLGTYRDIINERAKGELVINWIGGPEVIPPFDLAGAVKDGAADFAMVPPGYCEKVHPASISFQLAKYTPVEERGNGSYEFMAKLLEQQLNVRYLGILNSGYQYRLFSNVLIKNPRTDFKGLKFRTGPDAAVLLDALGIVGVSMTAGDMYNGLQQGVVVGVASVASNFHDGALFEVCKYWIDPGFWSPIEVGLINLDKWKTIPKHLQDLLLDVAKEVEPLEYKFGTTTEAKYFQTFKEKGMQGITFSPEDTKWYLDIAYGVRWDFAKKAMKPEDYEKARQLWAN